MAGRNVGNIEVTVDADTSKLKAQLIKAGEEGGEGAAEAIDEALGDIGGAGLKKAIAEIRAEIEEGLSDIAAEITPTLPEGRLAEIAEEINTTVSGIDAEISPVVNESALIAAAEEINTVVSGIDAEISPTVSPVAAAQARAQLAAVGSGGGRQAADDFGFNFLDVFSGRMKAIIGAVIVLAEPLAVLLEGALSAAVQVASSAFSALAGSMGAALPILAGLGATLGAVVIGSLGVGKAIKAVTTEFAAAADEGRAFNFEAEKIQKTLGNLGPAAQAVVRAFADLFPQLRAIQNVIAEHLFAGLGDELSRLSQETIPDIGAAFALAADSANRFFRGLADAASEIDFAGTFAAVQPAIDALGRAIGNVVRAIEPFLKAAAPAARELAAGLEAASASLLDMIRSGAASGALTRFFQEGIESLRTWWTLIRNTGEALFTLFQAGKRGGDDLVGSLADIIGRFNDWMQSLRGQQALAQFFETGRQVMHDLVPLLKGLQGFFENLVSPGAIGRFGDLTEALGEILPMLGSMLELVGRVGILSAFAELLVIIARALEPILPDLQEMATIIGVNLAGAVRALTPLIETLATVIGAVASLFNDLPGPIQAVVLGIGALIALRGQISSFGSALSSTFATIQTNIATLGTAAGLAKLAIGDIFTGIKAGNFAQVSQGLKDLGPALAATAKGVGAAAGTAIAAGLGVAFGLQMAQEAHSIAGQVTGIVSAIGSSIAAFAAGGPIVGGAALGIGLIANAFLGSAKKAEEARAEVDEFAAALLKMREGADDADAVNIVLDKLKGKGDDVRDAFQKMGLSVGDWADTVISGSKSAQEATADWIETIVGAGDPLVDMVRSGEVSLGKLADAFDLANTDAGVVRGTFAHLGDTLAANNISMQDAHGMFELLNDSQSQLGKGAEEAARQTFEAGSALDEQADSAETAATGLSDVSDVTVETSKAMTDLETALSGPVDGFASLGDAVFGIAAPMSDAEREMIGVGKAAEAASKAADAMRDAFDKLVSPTLDSQQALSDYQQAVDDLSQSLTDNGKTLDLNSEQGRANSEAIRNSVQSIADWGEAALASGVKAEDVNTIMQGMRQQLIDQVGAFDTGTQSAEEYVAALGLTPETITTIVETPGLLDATAKILDYDNDLDGIPDTIDTAFSANNLDVVKAHLAEYGVDLSGVPDSVLTEFLQKNWEQVHGQTQTIQNDMTTLDQTTATPEVAVPTAPAASEQVAGVKSDVDKLDKATANPNVSIVGNAIVMLQLAAIQEQLKQLGAMKPAPAVTLPTYPAVIVQTATMIALLSALDRTKADPDVSLSGYATVYGQIAALMVLLAALDRVTARPSIVIDGISTAINQVNTLATAIANLRDKTVTVTTRNVATTVGGMAGALIGGPMTMNVGERGYAEALVPLQLPLNRVNPEVRDMAALLRGEGVATAVPTGGKVVNNYMTVQLTGSDPRAVATQVMNRAAALAN